MSGKDKDKNAKFGLKDTAESTASGCWDWSSKKTGFISNCPISKTLNILDWSKKRCLLLYQIISGNLLPDFIL